MARIKVKQIIIQPEIGNPSVLALDTEGRLWQSMIKIGGGLDTFKQVTGPQNINIQEA